MEQTPKQQTIELIKGAKRILVMGHQGPDGDSLGSTLALTLALRKFGKEVKALASDPVPATLKFLPGADEVTDQIDASSDFVISVDTTDVEIDKLGYKNHLETRKLNIVIKTKSGQLTPERVSYGAAGSSADLIICVDTNDVERLGPIYQKYSQVFYQTPIVNIDHHPGNAYFGKVNWVDLAATSTAEILVSFMEALSQVPRPDGSKGNLLDPDIATLLLTGLTTDTGSFQNTNTTPKSFTVAAQLVAAGARQQEIVQHIYKTKPLSTLKLWGKVLSNIREEAAARFVYSTASATDFKSFGASDSETSGVVDELLKTVPGIDFAMLLSEKREGLYGSLRGVNPDHSVSEVAALFGGGGHKMAAAFRIPGGSLADNEQEVIGKIKEFQTGPKKTEDSSQKSEGQPTNAEFKLPGSDDQLMETMTLSEPESETPKLSDAVKSPSNQVAQATSSPSDQITPTSPTGSDETGLSADMAGKSPESSSDSTPPASPNVSQSEPTAASDKASIPSVESLKQAQANLAA